jgi:hypothetical protein
MHDLWYEGSAPGSGQWSCVAGCDEEELLHEVEQDGSNAKKVF